MAQLLSDTRVSERLWDDLEVVTASGHYHKPLRILLATDGSDSAQEAQRFLGALKLPTGSTVRAVTVVEEQDWEESEWLLAAHREWGEKVAGQASASLSGEGVEASGIVRTGATAPSILEAAEEMDAHLIVLGSRGLTGLEGFLVGSIARNVAKHSPRPVLVAHAPQNGLRRVILAVDGSEHSEDAVRLTAHLPLPEETEILVTHVIRPYQPFAPVTPGEMALMAQSLEEIRSEQREAARGVVDAAASELRRIGKTRVSAEIREGDPADEILALARERTADLVVAGARGISMLEGLLLGSVADRLLKHSERSLLLVH